MSHPLVVPYAFEVGRPPGVVFKVSRVAAELCDVMIILLFRSE